MQTTQSQSFNKKPLILFSIVDMTTRDIVAVSTIIPLPSKVKEMALERGHHLSVNARGIKIYDTKWYLPNLGGTL